MRETEQLIQLYKSADASQLEAGHAWYREANQFCQRIASETGNSLDTVCKVVSALSPQLSWEKNKLAAELLLHGKPMQGTGGFKKSILKARNIVRGKLFSCSKCLKSSGLTSEPFCAAHAPKTFCFYRNLLNPDDTSVVTIDRHAATAFYGQQMLRNKFDYWYVAGQYIRAAAELLVIPCVLQATIWTVIRDKFAYWHATRDDQLQLAEAA